MCQPGSSPDAPPTDIAGRHRSVRGGEIWIDEARAPQYPLRFPDAGQPSALWRMDRSNRRIQVQWSSAVMRGP